MKILFLLVLLPFLASCSKHGGYGATGSPLWRLTTSDAEKTSYYESNCRSYGFKKGTDAFANCMMREVDKMDERRRQQSENMNKLFKPVPYPTRKKMDCYENAYGGITCEE